MTLSSPLGAVTMKIYIQKKKQIKESPTSLTFFVVKNFKADPTFAR